MVKKIKRTFNPGSSKGLNIESIIGAPLVAASTANSMMLKEQTKFLMEFCFSKNGDAYDPVMIEMSITKSVLEPGQNMSDPASVKRIQTSFHLPLITIVPINSLAVDGVTVEFDMEITSQTTIDSDFSNSKQEHFGSPEERTQLMGKISYDSKENSSQSGKRQYKTQNSSNLKVNVNAGPLPLPVGISTLLDLYVKSIQPLQLNSVENKTTETEK